MDIYNHLIYILWAKSVLPIHNLHVLKNLPTMKTTHSYDKLPRERVWEHKGKREEENMPQLVNYLQLWITCKVLLSCPNNYSFKVSHIKNSANFFKLPRCSTKYNMIYLNVPLVDIRIVLKYTLLKFKLHSSLCTMHFPHNHLYPSQEELRLKSNKPCYFKFKKIIFTWLFLLF